MQTLTRPSWWAASWYREWRGAWGNGRKSSCRSPYPSHHLCSACSTFPFHRRPLRHRLRPPPVPPLLKCNHNTAVTPIHQDVREREGEGEREGQLTNLYTQLHDRFPEELTNVICVGEEKSSSKTGFLHTNKIARPQLSITIRTGDEGIWETASAPGSSPVLFIYRTAQRQG